MNKQKINCEMCGGDRFEKLPYLIGVPYLEHSSSLLNDLEILSCMDCGLGSTFPEKSWSVMEKFYEGLYRNPKSVAKERIYVNSMNPIKIHPKTERAMAHWLLAKSYCDMEGTANFCDIGPGPGYSFQAANLLNIKIKMYAFEGDKYSRESLRSMGVNVYEQVFSPSVELPSEKFNVVFMSHVLEHYNSSEIVPILNKVKNMLVEEGVFLCEVPNNPADFLNDKRPNVAPHLTFWTEKSLKRAFELAGLNCLFISSCGSLMREQKAGTCLVELPNKMNSKTTIEDFLVNYPPLYKLISYLKNFRANPSIFKILSGSHFRYGVRRAYLRAICSVK